MTDTLDLPRSEAVSAERDCGFTALTSISVRELPVRADIGILQHEVGQPQPLIVSVTLRLRPVETDSLVDTLDYRDVVAMAQALGLERIGLIESFARRLAQACLEHPAVFAADVQVDKPQALPEGLASTRIVLQR